MNNLFSSPRSNRAFTRTNVALSLCALALTSSFLAAKAKEAFAYGPGDGNCASIIGTANCPSGWTNQGFTATVNTTCRQSSAWWGDPFNGPYYNCCTYAQRFRQCYLPSTNTTTVHSVEYLRSNSRGSSTCFPNYGGTGQGQCLSN